MNPESNSRKSIFLSVSLLSIALLLFSCNEMKSELVPVGKELTEQDYINRGEYLVKLLAARTVILLKEWEKEALKSLKN